MNITYDGETFRTWAELAVYCAEKFGETGSANYIHLENYGCDLAGQEMFLNGTVYAGRTRMALDALGLGSQTDAVRALTNNAQQSYNSWAEVASTRSAETATIAGSQYTNTAMQLGSEEAQGGQVLIATKPTVTSNGTVLNQPNITAVKETADPTVPGTFSYLATLKALGWLPLPTWTAAAAPLLGVSLGAGLYNLNPQLWEKISRTLLPFCYDDNGTPKMPISVGSDGTVHTPEDAIEALRQLFIEEGVYTGKREWEEIDDDTEVLATQDVTQTPVTQYTVYKATYNQLYPNFVHTLPVRFTNEEVIRQVDVISIGNSTDGYKHVTPEYFIGYTEQGSNTCYAVPLIRASDLAGYTDRVVSGGYGIESLYPSYWTSHTPTPVWKVRINGTDYYTTNLISYGNVTASEAGWSSSPLPITVTGGNEEIYAALAYATSVIEGDIDGTSRLPGAKYPSDGTKHMREDFPDWYDDGIDVLSNPAKTLFEEGVKQWLPLALSDTNYSDNTDDSYSTKDQTDSQSGENTDDNQIEQLIEALRDLTETLTEDATLPENPTQPDNPSGDTPSPTPPVITGAGTDLIAIYNPTKAQIQQFNQFLWDLDPTNLVNWKKVIANPIDAVISLHMIYVTPVTGETRNIKCGYIETNVPSAIVTNQYKEIDCGTVTIGEYFHNVWDYIGTHIEIYLPFVGIVPLHVSDVMGSTIKVRYRVDVYTGACLAQIIVYKGNSFGTLYTYAGNCAVPLPLTSGSFTGVFSTLLSMGASAITAGVTGSAMTPAIAAGVTGMRSVSSIQQNIQRSGSIGSNVGALGIRTPYVIITRKIPLDAHLYQTQYGFPANKTVRLGSLSGYTRVKDIHLAGIPCTDDELEQIESLLKDGVIIN